jgi:hypothetical protein
MGILNCEEGNRGRCGAFVRLIDGIENHVDDKLAERFVCVK